MWNLINIVAIRLGLKKERELALSEVVDRGLEELGLEPHPKRATYLSRKQMREAARYIIKLSGDRFSEDEVIKELIRKGTGKRSSAGPRCRRGRTPLDTPSRTPGTGRG